jgi:hypothetical protein
LDGYVTKGTSIVWMSKDGMALKNFTKGLRRW